MQSWIHGHSCAAVFITARPTTIIKSNWWLWSQRRNCLLQLTQEIWLSHQVSCEGYICCNAIVSSDCGHCDGCHQGGCGGVARNHQRAIKLSTQSSIRVGHCVNLQSTQQSSLPIFCICMVMSPASPCNVTSFTLYKSWTLKVVYTICNAPQRHTADASLAYNNLHCTVLENNNLLTSPTTSNLSNSRYLDYTQDKDAASSMTCCTSI